MRISDWSSDVCSSDLLVHWATRHGDDHYRFRGREISGGELAEEVRADLTESLTGAADFNRVFTQNGIACTTTSLIAATRGITRLDEITEAEVPAICRSEEHTSELQSLMRISYAVFCLQKKPYNIHTLTPTAQLK